MKVFIVILFYITTLHPLSGLAASTYSTQLNEYCKLKTELDCQDDLTPNSKANLSVLQMSTVLACQNYYQSNLCEDVKNSLGKNKHLAVITCDPQKLCSDFAELDKTKCALDGAKSQLTFVNLTFLISAGIGGNVAMAASLARLPLIIYSAGKSAEECHQDLNFKAMNVKLHNLSLMENEKPLDVNGKDQAVLNMQCADLSTFLNKRLDVLSQKRSENDRWSLTKLTHSQSPESRAMLKLLRSNKCIRPRFVQEGMCKGLSALATGLVISGGSRVASTSKIFTPPKYESKRMSWSYLGEQSAHSVKYFNRAERAKLKITVASDGRILKADGTPMNVSKGVYVMDKEGNIYIVPRFHPDYKIHHSSIFAGGPVAAAGEITTKNGTVTMIDRSSGHYKPTSVHFQQVLDELKAKGADISNAKSVNNYE
jgi:hypothetical protein